MWLLEKCILLVLLSTVLRNDSYYSADGFLSGKCGPYLFHCDGGKCINESLRCNEINDCKDSSDEQFCGPCERDSLFRCNNTGICISKEWTCNGENDCGDLSDEIHCDESLTGFVSYGNCSAEHFRCRSDSLCIPSTWRCDVDKDCKDGSDENACDYSQDVPCVGFLCKSNYVCIGNSSLCDGTNDCEDGSDELNCDQTEPKKVNGQWKCRHSMEFPCADGSKCISVNNVCDKIIHCPDGSDEGSSCGNSGCKSLKCAHECRETPHNASCFCFAGYEIANDNQSCTDIDECQSSDTNACSQNCINTSGSYECSCVEDYELKDNTKCIAKGDEPVLLFSTDSSIRAYYLRSRVYNLVHEKLNHLKGIAFDGISRRIYWCDTTKKEESIVSSRLDGSDTTVFISMGVKDPEDVAVDWIGRNLYFTDADAKYIAACTLDEAKCRVILNSGLDVPRPIVLDVLEGWMYWSDWGSQPYIGKAGMDGSERSILVSTMLVWPNGLSIDYIQKRLYWLDAKLGHVESIGLDGENRKLIIQNLHHPFSMAVFEDKIYWSDWKKKSIESCNKNTGKGHEILFKEVKMTPMGLHIYHPSLQKKGIVNPCSSSWCSYQCLISPNGGHLCVCPPGFYLGSDKRTCKEKVNETLILMVRGNRMAKFHPEAIGNNTFVEISIKRQLEAISALEYNWQSQTAYVSDIYKRKIYAINMKNLKIIPIVSEHLDSVEDLAYDWYGGNLYWVDAGHRTVEVISLSNNQRMILMRSSENTPMAITLVMKLGILFIAQYGKFPCIERMNMDGKERIIIFPFPPRTVLLSLAADIRAKRLFWTDSNSGKISYVSFNGKISKTLKEDLGRPISLMVYDTRLYWSDQKTTNIYWTKNTLEHDVNKIPIPFDDWSATVATLAVVTSTPPREDILPTNPCAKEANPCSHLCLLNPSNFSCGCPHGLDLSEDGKTCRAATTCTTDDDFQCKDINGCVPPSWRCDGRKDCADGSDEDDCNKNCPEGFFQCANAHYDCISNAWVCDGSDDCPDGSDEQNCSVCKKTEFRCNNGKCVLATYKCDNQDDCGDESDEKNCENVTCDTDQFKCTPGQCIGREWICDHHVDCVGGEDEFNCTDYNCDSDEFTCKNDRCVQLPFRCDGNDDCGDGSDEDDCQGVVKVEHCPRLMFYCRADKKCIPRKSQCDEKRDCSDGADEVDCFIHCLDNEESFVCTKGHCIPSHWKCDREEDCDDGSDETAELCGASDTSVNTTEVGCRNSEFRCDNGECIALSLVCNHYPDCKDSSDEIRECNAAGLSCAFFNKCTQKCITTPNGSRCTCNDGFYLSAVDNATCLDVDECEEDGKCSQKCENTRGSFKCSCSEGYKIQPDGRYCRAIGKTLSLLAIYPTSIISLSLNEYHLRKAESLGISLTDIDFDVKAKLVYWTDHEKGQINAIWNLMEENVETILKAPNPTSLASDWITSNIYYVSADSYIRLCSISSYVSCTTLLLRNNKEITSIVVDPSVGYLFWSETNEDHSYSYSSGKICRSRLDGQLSEAIVWTKILYPKDLVLDLVARRVYWTDAFLDRIESVTYEGTKRLTVIKGRKSPTAISLFEDDLYWVDAETNGLLKCNKFNCKNVEMLHNETEKIRAITIYHESRQPKSKNLCQDAPCSHICISIRQSYTCLCPDEMHFAFRSKTQCEVLATEERTNSGRFNPLGSNFNCSMFCYNRGNCYLGVNGTIECSCSIGFNGESCQFATPVLSSKVQLSTSSKGVVGVAVFLSVLVLCVIVALIICYTKRSKLEPTLAAAWHAMKNNKIADQLSSVKFIQPKTWTSQNSPSDDRRAILNPQDFHNPGYEEPVEICYIDNSTITEPLPKVELTLYPISDDDVYMADLADLDDTKFLLATRK